MAIKVGINGFGRIGRLLLKRAHQLGSVEVVGVNDLFEPAAMAYLLKYDSVHGRFPAPVEAAENGVKVAGRLIPFFKEREPAKIPWDAIGAEVVLEATGRFTKRGECLPHIRGSVKKVIITAPSKSDDPADFTALMGVNDRDYDPAKHNVLSNASCTTNCLAPVVKVIKDSFGIETCSFTTIHAYTATQAILDMPVPKELRRGRAAAVSMMPAETGAAKAITVIYPELKGKITGNAVRVPVPDGSLTDMTFRCTSEVSVESVNAALKAAASGPLSGILVYSEEPLVSSDIVGTDASSIVDGLSTQIISKPNTVKVLSWYDNEWGYASRVIDLALKIAS